MNEPDRSNSSAHRISPRAPTPSSPNVPPHLLSRPPADHRRIMATLGGQLTLNARRHPDRPALIFEGVERSYGQLDREINQYANALLSLGVQKGHRVAVRSPNSDRSPLPLYGGVQVE